MKISQRVAGRGNLVLAPNLKFKTQKCFKFLFFTAVSVVVARFLNPVRVMDVVSREKSSQI